MYGLASLRCPLGSTGFAWQAWDNVHCQGVECTPWRPFGVPWAPLLLRGRRGTMCTAKGSDVRPGVPPVFLGFAVFEMSPVEGCRASSRGGASSSTREGGGLLQGGASSLRGGGFCEGGVPR